MSAASPALVTGRYSDGSSPRGYLLIHLHAHLPFIRHPENERFLEESWLHEALAETYLPLLLVLDGLARDGAGFRLSISLTPTLLAMLDDPLLRGRFERKLDGLVELAGREVARHRHNAPFLETARFYEERLTRVRDAYFGLAGRDIPGAFRSLQERRLVELIPSAATHGYLPLLRHEPSAVRAQVQVAVEDYRRRFGRDPQGIWLPECAYYPGLDEVLADAGLRFFFVESHGVLHGSTRARYGVHAPVVCPSGVAAFARDPDCSKQVWSATEGFPASPEYREFHRDIGLDLPLDYLGSLIGPDGLRVPTGIKYHRVTGPTEHKEPYVREQALRKAAEHAGLFLEWRRGQVEWLRGRMDRRPLVVAPYDAELFGHWWFEGPEFLDFLLRKIAFDQDDVVTVTPSEYLAEYPDGQVSVPSLSSWGERGYNEVWLNGSNDWLHPGIHRATREMAHLAFRSRGAEGLRRRFLNQAARELLLAQSSDWAFLMKTGKSAAYAARRAREHLESFGALAEAVAADGSAVSTEPLLRALEERNNIFPHIRFEVFEERLPRPGFAPPENPRHAVFVTAEAAPYVKVGGLADVAGALPAALAAMGVRVTLILPGYRSISRERFQVRPLAGDLSVLLGARRVPFSLLEASSPAAGVRVLLVDEPGFFDREGVYVDPKTGAEYPDTGDRFVFFTKAALEALRVLGEPVDIIHAHDHQTALAPAYLELVHRRDPVLGLAASVYTLHNLGYQGIHPPDVLYGAGFGRDQFHPGSPFEYHGQVNFMKVGIHFADKVNTVSERYAEEICGDEKMGAGLGGVLRDREGDFSGILNGIDTGEWNPAADPHIPRPYDASDLSGKREAKVELLRRAGFDAERIDAPLVGVISRLVDQKGVDLIAEALPRLLDLGIDLVVLGTGLAKYEKFFVDAAARHAGRVAVFLKFDNALAHLIEAGADMFLMPSLYEPCGLNQMYSLRYGTVPIVRETGGLADTVSDDDATGGHGVGFSFEPYDAGMLVDAVSRAVRAHRDPARWRGIVARGMARDNSWGASASRYFELYRDALARRT
jgi:1,4-alpha-glucan branching enzyme